MKRKTILLNILLPLIVVYLLYNSTDIFKGYVNQVIPIPKNDIEPLKNIENIINSIKNNSGIVKAIGKSESGLISLIVEEDIHKGKTVMKIPDRFVINDMNSNVSKFIQIFNSQVPKDLKIRKIIGDRERLALYILNEKNKGEKSIHYDFIQMIPDLTSNLVYDLPKKYLDIIKGTQLSNFISKQIKRSLKVLKIIKKLKVNVEEFKYYWAYTLSRSIRIPIKSKTKKSNSVLSIIPLCDLLQFKQKNNSALLKYHSKSRTYNMESLHNINKGTKISLDSKLLDQISSVFTLNRIDKEIITSFYVNKYAEYKRGWDRTCKKKNIICEKEMLHGDFFRKKISKLELKLGYIKDIIDYETPDDRLKLERLERLLEGEINILKYLLNKV